MEGRIQRRYRTVKSDCLDQRNTEMMLSVLVGLVDVIYPERRALKFPFTSVRVKIPLQVFKKATVTVVLPLIPCY